MLSVSYSAKFKRDYRQCEKRGYDMDALRSIVSILALPARLDARHKDHPLKGDRGGLRDCHIAPDWILIYRMTETDLYLERTGTHADLFG